MGVGQCNIHRLIHKKMVLVIAHPLPNQSRFLINARAFIRAFTVSRLEAVIPVFSVGKTIRAYMHLHMHSPKDP